MDWYTFVFGFGGLIMLLLVILFLWSPLKNRQFDDED